MLTAKELQEILHCPRCGEVMIHDRQGFWKCPKCSGEFWDDESRLAVIEQRARDAMYADRVRYLTLWSLNKPPKPVLPPVPVWVPGGGSRSGRRRKKPLKKLTTERYLLW